MVAKVQSNWFRLQLLLLLLLLLLLQLYYYYYYHCYYYDYYYYCYYYYYYYIVTPLTGVETNVVMRPFGWWLHVLHWHVFLKAFRLLPAGQHICRGSFFSLLSSAPKHICISSLSRCPAALVEVLGIRV